MVIRKAEKDGVIFIETVPGDTMIANTQDAVDLLSLAGSEKTNRVIIHADNLHKDFFDLKTGLAGEILQKFANYFIKSAIILTPDLTKHRKFQQMIRESNRNGDTGYFDDREAAMQWILG